jgi:hypothetical protein
MCIAPNKLEDGTDVGCRECWQCRKRRVNDLVGRGIAESRFSKKTYAITLTYAPRVGVNAVTLVYKDVQDMIKNIRDLFECRYIVAGEYGSKKGRAHWHIILFFKGPSKKAKKRAEKQSKKFNKRIVAPDYPDEALNKKVDWKYWKHGFSYFQEPDWKGFEYVLKYVLKDSDSRSADAHLAMSKKPPLGAQYFNWLADEHVRQGLVPQSYFYKFGDIRDYKNRDKSFMMTGRTKEKFMERFLERWLDKYDTDPRSEIVDQYIDDVTELEFTDEELMARLHYKPVKYIQPWEDYGDGKYDGYIQHDMEYEGIPLVVFEYDDEFHIITEHDKWHEKREVIIEQIQKRSKKIRSRKLTEILREEWYD